MPISYLQAREILDAVAQEIASSSTYDEEELEPLLTSAGRRSTREIRAPSSIPAFDTSAMDGYALRSELTLSASNEEPVLFRIDCISAAGDEPITLGSPSKSLLPLCSEIMTGAQFPIDADGYQLDACLPVEQARLVTLQGEMYPCLKVVCPIPKNQHRRFAGSDLTKGDTLVDQGEIIGPQHVIGLAALGMGEVVVQRKLRVNICITGSEVVPFDHETCLPHHIRDSSGPYITQVLRGFGTLVTHLEPVSDDVGGIRMMLRQFLNDKTDILVTTGGVSAGRFDLVRECIEAEGASIQFHKVGVRPGHPVLFATFDRGYSECLTKSGSEGCCRKAFFGLPGNPIASAACLQFFVLPFIHRLRGEPPQKPIHARLKHCKQDIPTCNGPISSVPKRQIDIFRHGHLRMDEDGFEVATSLDQASYKVGPIAKSNCWVWFPSCRDIFQQDELLPCFPFSPFDHLLASLPRSFACKHPTRALEISETHILQHSQKPVKLKVVILAGGQSSRMGYPKHLLKLSQQLAYEKTIMEIQKSLPRSPKLKIYLSLRDDQQVLELKQMHLVRHYDVLPWDVVVDQVCVDQLSLEEDIGPAAGLLSAHIKDPTSDWLVVACDFPLLKSECIAQLIDEHYYQQEVENVVIPAVTCFTNRDGFNEPLLAVWSSHALEQLKQNVIDGVRGPSSTVKELSNCGRAKLLKPLDERWILNANTPAELQACLRLEDKRES